MKDWTSHCGEFVKVGSCECGKRFARIIFCGREWCKNCNKITHNRRIARWLPKALTMQSFGYFVFTIPSEMREFYKSKEHLSQLRTYLRRRLKQVYPNIRALSRWHWFGAESHTYHPHLNIMVDGFQKLSNGELETIKKTYKDALERFTGIGVKKSSKNLRCKVNVYYHYYSVEGFKKKYAKKHKKISDEQAKKIFYKARWDQVVYITRPTFLRYQKELAGKLKGYHNCSCWGQFSELSYEEVEHMAIMRETYSKVSQEVILIESGHCPCCGKKIHWHKKLYPSGICNFGEELGGGYFMLDSWPRGSPVKLPERWQIQKARDENFVSGRIFADL